MKFGTRVDWISQVTAITGVRIPEGMQFILSTSHLEVGRGVTPCHANQAWSLITAVTGLYTLILGLI